jgi:O-antigen/teichoic acid export membrane protein
MQYAPIVSIVGLITGAAALWLLVPRYGVWGALWALVIANGAKSVVLLSLSYYFYPRPLLFGRLKALAGIAVMTFWAASAVATENLVVSALIKSVIIFAGTAAILWFVLYGPRALVIYREWRSGPGAGDEVK